MLRSLLATAFGVLLFTSSAHAASETYVLDKPHTQILFKVSHMGFSNSSGRFLDYSGSFTYDPLAPETSHAEVTIPVKSLDMGDALWTEHTQAMFEADKFPDMTFKSTSVKKTGDKTAEMTGDLTLHGVTKPVTLTVTENSCGTHPMSKKPACGFDATGTLKRSEFGVDKGIPMVGDEVQISITAEGQTAGDQSSADQNK